MKRKLVNILDIEKEICFEEENNKKNGLCLNTNNTVLVFFIRGKEKNWRLRILEHSKKNYLDDGIYNEERNCYYPKELLKYKDIAEKNKLEKLFKKYGLKKV